MDKRSTFLNNCLVHLLGYVLDSDYMDKASKMVGIARRCVSLRKVKCLEVKLLNAGVAQLAEHLICNQVVVGSKPSISFP